ncbi:peptidase C39 [Ectothiorhodospira shaposhnikovii]|uniref:C39 family peptidase n=1 Tax=Ectothiorhodospira shaposhnikovii TaxID=1054 RepID=UPI001908FF3D|nr:C39 family peptidase [Ectothiorhodospira shaposhnikovii]MBK1672241.1 peptidase C39 [Ectothiorhodospira shaposhnikovii]
MTPTIKKSNLCCILTTALWWCGALHADGIPFEEFSGVLLSTHSTMGTIAVRSWKQLRDDRIVKQELDYSCGAASLATLLNEFYGQNLTEIDLLKAMNKGDGRASFEDMQQALPQFGFKAQGFAASWKQMTSLRIPVVVYLKHRKDDHFSVLRGISDDVVWLSDPSLGNRTFSRSQFLAMWETRHDHPQHPELSGKFLAILPLGGEDSMQKDFFTRTPERQSAQAVNQLIFRSSP